MARQSVGPYVLLGASATAALGAGLLLVSGRGEPPAAPPAPPPPLPEPPPTPEATGPASPAAEDLEALARMFASEDGRFPVRVVLGYFTIIRAQRRGISVHRLLTGKSGEFGPQYRKDINETRYASTAKPATEATRRLALQLLTGEIQPSPEIQAHPFSAWVERGVGGYTSLKMLQRQVYQADARDGSHKKGDRDFGGLWGRLDGTEWFFFDAKAPVLPIPESEEEAAAVLADAPRVPALYPVNVS